MTRWTLADIPWDRFDPARVDAALGARMALARQVVESGLAVRTANKLMVRQPLARAIVLLTTPEREQDVQGLAELIADSTIDVRGFSVAVIGTRFIAYIGFDSPANAIKAANIIQEAEAETKAI